MSDFNIFQREAMGNTLKNPVSQLTFARCTETVVKNAIENVITFICDPAACTGSSPHTQRTTSSQYLENKSDEMILPRPNSLLRPMLADLSHLSENYTLVSASGNFSKAHCSSERLMSVFLMAFYFGAPNYCVSNILHHLCQIFVKLSAEDRYLLAINHMKTTAAK